MLREKERLDTDKPDDDLVEPVVYLIRDDNEDMSESEIYVDIRANKNMIKQPYEGVVHHLLRN